MEFLSYPEFLTDNIFIRLLVAAVLGGLVGMERDMHGRAAGLRTNLLVCLGAAVFMLISIAIAGQLAPDAIDTGRRVDPSRIAAQIITGIGFLGAGTIIKTGFSVRGLTTAATLWTVAGVGMAAGAGFFILAAFVTAIALVSLIVLNPLERIYAKDTYRILEVRTPLQPDLSGIIAVLQRSKLKILHLDFERDYARKRMLLRFTLRLYSKGVADKRSHQIVRDLEDSGYPISRIRWYHQ